MQTNYSLFTSRHLLNVYRRLRNSSLSRNKDTSEDSLNEFVEILSEVMPSTDEGIGMYNTYRTLYKRTGRSFLNLIDRAGMRHLILWTDAKLIHREFDLPKGVYLYWRDGTYLLEFNREETLSKRTIKKNKTRLTQSVINELPSDSDVSHIQIDVDSTGSSVTVVGSKDWADSE